MLKINIVNWPLHFFVHILEKNVACESVAVTVQLNTLFPKVSDRSEVQHSERIREESEESVASFLHVTA